MPPLGKDVCADEEGFFSFVEELLDDFSFPDDDEFDLDALEDFVPFPLLLELSLLAELSLGLARKRFQFLIKVLARAITSSSLLLLRSSFTVMPMRVFVNISRLIFNVCNVLSKSNACSCPYKKHVSHYLRLQNSCFLLTAPSLDVDILPIFFWIRNTSSSTLILMPLVD